MNANKTSGLREERMPGTHAYKKLRIGGAPNVSDVTLGTGNDTATSQHRALYSRTVIAQCHWQHSDITMTAQ